MRRRVLLLVCGALASLGLGCANAGTGGDNSVYRSGSVHYKSFPEGYRVERGPVDYGRPWRY